MYRDSGAAGEDTDEKTGGGVGAKTGGAGACGYDAAASRSPASNGQGTPGAVWGSGLATGGAGTNCVGGAGASCAGGEGGAGSRLVPMGRAWKSSLAGISTVKS